MKNIVSICTQKKGCTLKDHVKGKLKNITNAIKSHPTRQACQNGPIDDIGLYQKTEFKKDIKNKLNAPFELINTTNG